MPVHEAEGPAWSVVHVARPGIERQRAQELLGWSPEDECLTAAEVFVLVDPSVEEGEGVGAAAFVVGVGPGERELRRIAVIEGSSAGALGRRVIEEVGNTLRRRGDGVLHARLTAVPDDLADLLSGLGFRPCGPRPLLALEL